MSVPGAIGPPPQASSASALLRTPGSVDCQGWNLMPFGQSGSVSPALLQHLPSPCRPVLLRPGATILPFQIEYCRPSYILALLIQSRGVDSPSPCHHRCHRDLGIFAECRHLPGVQHGACGNCVWQSHALECMHADNFVGPQPAAVLGKRKRETRSALAASSDDTPISGHDDSPEAVFRRHFEAQFEPLEKSLIEAEALEVAAQSRESSIGEDESDWNGLSDSDDGSTIEIVEHIMTNGARRNKLSKEELKSFMTPKPPSTNPTPLSAIKREDPDLSNASEAAIDASNLRKDLALQRLLSESHLLHPSTTSTTFSPSGHNRHKALDMRLQTLGSRNSILMQKKMPYAHRKGILAKKESKEEERRREAKENGIVLEKAKKEKKDGRVRKRGVDAPIVGKFRGGILRLSRRDVASIMGSRKRELKAKGRRSL